MYNLPGNCSIAISQDSVDQPTLSAIHSVLKTIVDQNKKTSDSLHQLAKRVSVIEHKSDFSDPINLPRPKRKLPSDSHEPNPVPCPSKAIKCAIFSSAKQLDLGVKPDNVPRSQNVFPLPSSSGLKTLKALKEKELSSGSNEEVQPGSDSDCSIEDSVNDYYVSICSDDDMGDGNSETCISGNNDDAPGFRKFPTLSRSDNATWHPSTYLIDWYKVVADTELDDEQIASVTDDFKPPDDLAAIFEPPLLSKAIWSRCKSFPAELQLQKSLSSVQKTVSSAIKPLLSVLDSLDSSDPNRAEIASAIQLSHANLKTSRVCRRLLSRHLLNEVKPGLFSQPVTFSELFGSPFENAVEEACKSYSSENKGIFIPQPKQHNLPSHRVHPSSSSHDPPVSRQSFRDHTGSGRRPSSNLQGTNKFQSSNRGYTARGRSKFPARARSQHSFRK